MTIHWNVELYVMVSPWKFHVLELQLDTYHFFVSFFWRWHDSQLPFRASIGRRTWSDKAKDRVRRPWKQIKIGEDYHA